MNIFAHTAFHQPSYPEYVSVNERGDRIEITVRDEPVMGALGVRCGVDASIQLTRAQFADFIERGAAYLARKP